MKFGQRGVAFMGPLCHLIAYIIIAVHPPYPVLIIAYMLAGLGNGIEDSGWNAWVGAMEDRLEARTVDGPGRRGRARHGEERHRMQRLVLLHISQVGG